MLLSACGNAEESVASDDESDDPAIEAPAPSEDEADADAAAEEPVAEEPEAEPVELIYANCGTMQAANTAQTAIPEILGFWEDENLAVEEVILAGSGECVQALDAGNIDVTITATPSLASPIAQGADNLVAIGAYVVGNIYTPFVPAESPIEEPADFDGSTIGVGSLEASSVPMFVALLNSVGLDRDSVDFVPVGFSPGEVSEFLRAGRIDAYAQHDGAQAALQEVMDMRAVTNETFENVGFHVIFATRRDVLEEKREALVGLMRGIAKGVVVARENPEAGVAMLYQQWPENRPTGVADEDLISSGLSGLVARLENIQPVDGLLFNGTREQMSSHFEVLIAAETMPALEEPMDSFIDRFWDGSLLEDTNDFDADQIAEQARSLVVDDFLQ
ncbi:putative exported protein [Euzebya pacifica]|uniref:Putative exported protein n=1 Tax=Euzebya pacifica TaxID=1608957 RepID=A0A346XWR0_9ACTN|nr:ABC transporter substrate-binding protein [Euzebya pacifica]AXV06657.1 putative exported protein [Euzebya pacifica]